MGKGKVALYLGFAEDGGGEFVDVCELRFDTVCDAWDACDSGFASLNLWREVCAQNHRFASADALDGYSAAAICEEGGRHGFFLWLD